MMTDYSRKWTTREVAEATGYTYDSVCGYLRNRNSKPEEGMTIKMVLDYLSTGKRDRAKVDKQNVEDLKQILELLNPMQEREGEDAL